MSDPFSAQARRIRELVLDDRIGDALQALYDLTREVAPGEADRVMPSIAAHKRLEREHLAGTITAEDERVQRARFVQTIEGLLGDLERRLPGPVDVGIITIREDEHNAVLQRFPEPIRTVTLQRRYRLRRLPLASGDALTVAVVRCAEQGNGEAHEAARDLIEDLAPAWILVVGIAGGVPANEFSLGDVVVSTRIVDFSVEAVLKDHSREHALAGGPLHPAAGRLAADISAMVHDGELGAWSTETSISKPRPPVVIEGARFYGDDAWKENVREKIARHFDGKPARAPLVTTGAVASSDRLIKEAEILAVWLKVARQVQVVEMESAGVYRAAHGKQVPFLAIRGISDVVGFERHADWIEYACHTAAAFTRAFLATGAIHPGSS
jgi:nucleoside phosphorylase